MWRACLAECCRRENAAYAEASLIRKFGAIKNRNAPYAPLDQLHATSALWVSAMSHSLPTLISHYSEEVMAY